MTAGEYERPQLRIQGNCCGSLLFSSQSTGVCRCSSHFRHPEHPIPDLQPQLSSRSTAKQGCESHFPRALSHHVPKRLALTFLTALLLERGAHYRSNLQLSTIMQLAVSHKRCAYTPFSILVADDPGYRLIIESQRGTTCALVGCKAVDVAYLHERCMGWAEPL